MIIAAYQGAPIEGDIESGFSKLDEILGQAAAQNAQMLVFPELYFPGYNQQDLMPKLAEPAGGPWEDRFATLAQKHGCGLTIGWAERGGETLYNSASAFDAKGAKLGHFRKLQLWGPQEQATFEFGDSYTVFDLDGIKTAILICYDVEFINHTRALADLGVRLILVPTANPEGYGEQVEMMIRANAADRGLTIVYANFCGRDNGLDFGGNSVIVAPDASILARAAKEPSLLIADFNDTTTIDPQFLLTYQQDYRKVSQ
jgi:predicted amidohydrolase